MGQNNHGKTNVFEAVSWFYAGKGSVDNIRFGRIGQDEVSVEITFDGAQEALGRMKNENNRVKIENFLNGRDTIRAKRVSGDVKTRKLFDEEKGSWVERNPAGFDAAFNDFLPVFEYIDTATHLADVAKFGKTTALGTMLSAVLMALLEQSKPYQDFRRKFDDLFTAPDSDVRVELNKISSQVTLYIAKQFPDCVKVCFQIAEPAFDELLKGCTTEIDDGIVTDATEKGDGMQRALMLAILQTYADYRRRNEATGKNFLFFIDEAELHLHPTAQRNLKNALKDIVKAGDQVFINTHSSVLVTDEVPGQEVFKVQKIDKKTLVSKISQKQKTEVIYELLGGSPSDILLPRNFLIVEGLSDHNFIRSVISRFYPLQPEVQIIFSEGDHETQRRSMNAIHRLFSPLTLTSVYRDRLVLLCDAPHPDRLADFDTFKNAYAHLERNRQLHVLPCQSIEEYYPDEFRQTTQQVEQLSRSPGLKRQMADHVSKLIDQEQFERGMPIIYEAIRRCWELSHS
ncbi:MAG: ATP-dependent nuclease [Janthinobacterium lividum]